MKKEHLHNKVVHELIAKIASGAFEVSKRLPPERVLCQQLDVSRGTLRKALTALEELGAVTIKPNSGVYVRGISTARLPRRYLPPDFDSVNLQDVIEARKAIELPAAEMACRNAKKNDLKALAAILEEMACNLDDISVFLEADLAFHQTLVRASGNVVLVTAFEAIYEYHRFCCIFSSQQTGSEELALDYHRKVLSALEKRQAKKCVKCLADHLDSMRIFNKTWKVGQKRLLDGQLTRSNDQ